MEYRLPVYSRLWKVVMGLLILVISALEFVTQITGLVITIDSVTFGPIRKFEASGLGIILFFKGALWYIFLFILLILMIVGILLLISGISGRPVFKYFKYCFLSIIRIKPKL